MYQQCAPGIIYNGKSCISINILENMIDLYKNKYPKEKINIIFNGITHNLEISDSIITNKLEQIKKFNPITYKKHIVDILSQLLKNSKQIDWISIPIFKELRKNNYNDLLNNTFKPIGPANNNKWLSNFDIQDIFAQYENYYKDFKFLGAIPRDFDNDKRTNISNINYKQQFINNGITKLGVIFNHDESHQSGSHWVALFIDLLAGNINYFDSVGKPPKKEIMNLINTFQNYFKKNNISSIININNVQHQQKGSECGVYSVSFILRLLDGESFADITKNPIADDEIQQCRKIYFNNIDDNI